MRNIMKIFCTEYSLSCYRSSTDFEDSTSNEVYGYCMSLYLEKRAVSERETWVEGEWKRGKNGMQFGKRMVNRLDMCLRFLFKKNWQWHKPQFYAFVTVQWRRQGFSRWNSSLLDDKGKIAKTPNVVRCRLRWLCKLVSWPTRSCV